MPLFLWLEVPTPLEKPLQEWAAAQALTGEEAQADSAPAAFLLRARLSDKGRRLFRKEERGAANSPCSLKLPRGFGIILLPQGGLPGRKWLPLKERTEAVQKYSRVEGEKMAFLSAKRLAARGAEAKKGATGEWKFPCPVQGRLIFEEATAPQGGAFCR